MALKLRVPEYTSLILSQGLADNELPCSFVHISVATFLMHQWSKLSSAVVTETTRPAKPKLFPICPFTEKVC